TDPMVTKIHKYSVKTRLMNKRAIAANVKGIIGRHVITRRCRISITTPSQANSGVFDLSAELGLTFSSPGTVVSSSRPMSRTRLKPSSLTITYFNFRIYDDSRFTTHNHVLVQGCYTS